MAGANCEGRAPEVIAPVTGLGRTKATWWSALTRQGLQVSHDCPVGLGLGVSTQKPARLGSDLVLQITRVSRDVFCG